MIHIVTDSTCEAPYEVMHHPAVHVVPLSVVFGKQALRDEVEITRAEFWERLPKANPLPTTSQAVPNDFFEVFKPCTETGDEVVAVCLSGKLSGTYEAAAQAQASLSGRPIDVVDSYSISVGQGIMVQVALEMATSGASRAQIVSRLLEMRDEVRILFSLDTLEYLQKGGRIGKAQALVGSLLKFKPLLAIQEGEVAPVGRARSRGKALEQMIQALTHEVSERGPNVRLGVTHAGVPDEAAQVAQALEKEFGTARVFICTLGPVIGVHVGLGTIGAAVYHGVAN
jgi:DegV family protein with EDD domain